MPGQLGTSVIFGRSTTYGDPFSDLPGLHRGAQMQVTTGQGLFSYRIEDVRHNGDPQPPALGPSQSRLLLVTTQRGTLGALSTVYVDAMLTSKSAPTPPHNVLAVAPAEDEMASDPSTLLPLALWLLVLVGGGAFAAWGLTHWGRSQTWLIAVPILFVALWGAADNAAMLLPNLM
jgi:sortase A